MAAKKSALYDAISKIATNKGVTILLDSDLIADPAFVEKRYHFDPETNILRIDGRHLGSQEKEDVIRLLREVQELGFLLLDSEQEAILDNYIGYSAEYNAYKDTLDLFTHKIPPNDLHALMMAYYMRIKYEKGEPIREYRSQIRDRFGFRGLYIGNLCNANYFEDSIRRNVLKLDIAKFKEYYELKVGQELAALFIHEGMTRKMIEAIIREKLRLCSLNGFFKFRVHAIGKTNSAILGEIYKYRDETDWGLDGLTISIKSESHMHPVYIDIEFAIP